MIPRFSPAQRDLERDGPFHNLVVKHSSMPRTSFRKDTGMRHGVLLLIGAALPARGRDSANSESTSEAPKNGVVNHSAAYRRYHQR